MHVESEVVLKCEGYNKESACDMLCENDCVVGDTVNPDSKTQVLIHTGKIVCKRATYARVECSVYTSRRLQGNRHHLQAKHLDFGICFFFLKKKNYQSPQLLSVTMKKIATTKTVAIPRKRSLVKASCHTTSSLSLVRHAPNLRRAKQVVGLVAVKLALGDEVCGELGQILDIDVL